MKRLKSSKQNEPKRHHYLPQFFLRNFTIDEECKKITVIRKHGNRAVWSKSSIKSIAYENELYVHTENGVPISVEAAINNNFETPISNSETWQKIKEGAVADLDCSDRKVLYSLVRNFDIRTPHYHSIVNNLTELANQSNSESNFSVEERAMYLELHSNPSLKRFLINKAVSDTTWTVNEFHSCGISIIQVANPVYVCTSPVHPFKVPNHYALRSIQMGLEPIAHLMPLTKNAYVLLILGDFDGAFFNQSASEDEEKYYKRLVVSNFAYWPKIQHMVCSAEELIDQLEWANYRCTKNTPNKKCFYRI